MSFLKELSEKNPKFAPFVGTLLCLGLGWERAHSFAQAQQKEAPPPAKDTKAEATPAAKAGNTTEKKGEKIDLPLPQAPALAKPETNSEAAKATDQKTKKRSELLQKVPLELRAVQKFDAVKTKQEACMLLEGKVVTYYDTASFVSGCVQRPIEDVDLLNELVYKQRKTVAEVPAHVYRLIPFGEPWVGKQQQNFTTSKVCRELNGRYVTSTGTDYFVIENCKKRAFSSYVELQAHNKRNAPVLTVSPEQLDKLDEGKTIEGSYDREVGALYRIVGDSALSPLGSADGKAKPVRSAEDLEALPESSGKTTKVDGKKLCKQFNNKVVSFYSQLFYITNCQKRPLKELPIAIQQRFSEQGVNITDMTSAQVDSIPSGKELTEDEALSLIK
ncbi:MAG: hypothetical protein FJY29_06940 [Betaproteobacteria bacterium]|nr:hypothetical protein [Betaproteobacteria bacterium]